MGYLSRYRAITPIGSMQAMPARAALLTLGDGSKWLRSGYLAPAASYPTAAALQHMRAHSFSDATGGAACFGLATNGAGTWVATRPTSTSVSVSTDNGQTWATVSTGAGSNLRKVVWAGSRFVAVGNDIAQIAAATSTDGLTWANNIVVSPGSGLTADTAVVAWNGTLVIATCQGPGSVYTSTTGTGSWTARTSSHVGAPGIDANAFQTVIFNLAGSTGARRSADGITWSGFTLPTANTAGSWPMLLADRLVYLTSVSGVSGFRTTLDFSTFTGLSVPPITISGGQTEHKFRSGSRIALTSSDTTAGQIAFTSDGAFWDVQSLSNLSGNYAYGEANGYLVGVPISGSTALVYAQSTIDASNAVGISAVVATGTAVTANSATFYARVQ